MSTDLFFETRECSWINKTDHCICHLFSALIQHSFTIFDLLSPLCEKNGIQKKNYITAVGSSHESTGQWFSCRNVVLKFGCGKLQVSCIKSKKVILTAKFIHIDVYVHTSLVLFTLFKIKFVMAA